MDELLNKIDVGSVFDIAASYFDELTATEVLREIEMYGYHTTLELLEGGPTVEELSEDDDDFDGEVSHVCSTITPDGMVLTMSDNQLLSTHRKMLKANHITVPKAMELIDEYLSKSGFEDSRLEYKLSFHEGDVDGFPPLITLSFKAYGITGLSDDDKESYSIKIAACWYALNVYLVDAFNNF